MLDSSKLRNHTSDVFSCAGTGTTYAALLDLELRDGIFSLDPNCVLFLYMMNNNGSKAFRDELDATLATTNVNGAAVSIVHWSYPCRQGQWSSDGIEHGSYRDANGLTIDDNDP